MFNRAISNAMAGNVDAELATDLVLLHTIVCERMWCFVKSCQRILDTRESGLIVVENKGSAVACGDCLDQILSNAGPNPGFRVVDARLYKQDGTLKNPNP